MNLMLLGAIAMSSFTASVFFLRFWKTTHDRFFFYLALSFGIEGLNRVILGLVERPDEQEPFFYLGRLLAFSVILWAIVEKNWLRSRRVRLTSHERCSLKMRF